MKRKMRIKGMNARNDFAVTGVYVKVINLLLAGTFRGSGSEKNLPNAWYWRYSSIPIL